MPGIETLILIVLTLARGAVTAAQVALGAGLLASSLGLLLALLVVFAHNRVLQAVTAVYIEWAWWARPSCARCSRRACAACTQASARRRWQWA